MSRSPLLRVLIPVTLALAPLARADYTFVFPTSAADSAAVNAAIPCKSFDEKKGTTTSLSASAGAIKLTATWGEVDEWGAAAGILLPLNKLWTPVDFSNVTSVTFSYKTGDSKTAIEFAPNSTKYIGAATDNGVMMLAEYAGATTFKKVTVAFPDGISFLDWMGKKFPAEIDQTWDDVKTAIKTLQFSPKPVYDAAGSKITGASTATLEIKDVSIQGEVKLGDNWITALGTRCSGSQFAKLDNFSGDVAGLPNQNRQGGYWFAFTDTTSGTAGLANGVSSLLEDENTLQGITYLPGDEANPGVAGITAMLDKGDAKAHPYAGWASLGTGFKDKTTGEDAYLDFVWYAGISFYISMAEGFDEANLTGVTVKVGNKSVGDSVAYSAGVPYAQFNNQQICLDFCQFKQPVWYSSKEGVKPMPLGDIGEINWEIKINSDTVVKAGTSTFYIGNVTFWKGYSGTCPTVTGISPRKMASQPTLVANYASGLVLSYALDGAASATIEVVRMDGAKEASFDGAAKASRATFPMNLARGTYLAVVRNGANRLVAPFAVMR